MKTSVMVIGLTIFSAVAAANDTHKRAYDYRVEQCEMSYQAYVGRILDGPDSAKMHNKARNLKRECLSKARQYYDEAIASSKNGVRRSVSQ